MYLRWAGVVDDDAVDNEDGDEGDEEVREHDDDQPNADEDQRRVLQQLFQRRGQAHVGVIHILKSGEEWKKVERGWRRGRVKESWKRKEP